MKKIVLISAVIFAACSPKHVPVSSNNNTANIALNGKMFATLFQQRSAEYRALCYQAFNIAKERIDEYKPVSNKPLAIITDIDETILDNSPYQAYRNLQDKDFEPASWTEWTTKGVADTMPGAAAFLNYAASKGVTIFYITNRDEKDRRGTIANLKKYNLPNSDDAHFIPKSNTSSKEPRRIRIAQTHEIVMLLGDNLGDFSVLFDKKTVDERNFNADISAADFGKRFIVLPNPVYGDWESSIFQYNHKLSAQQKDSVIRSMIKGY